MGLNAVLVFLAVYFTAALPGAALTAEPNRWGRDFRCGVSWFSPCLEDQSQQPESQGEKTPKEVTTELAFSLSPPAFTLDGRKRSDLPPPVRHLMESPSPETALEYVKWAREQNERIAVAAEYVAQAQELAGPPGGRAGQIIQRREMADRRGVVAFYYFFSPNDPTVERDMAVLRRVWKEQRVGVVAIPVRAADRDVLDLVNRLKPGFPVRRGATEIGLLNPRSTPQLYLALPLQKKIYKVGSVVDEKLIQEALARAVAELYQKRAADGTFYPAGPAVR